MSNVAETRAAASRVAKWLVDKGRPDEAVSVLAAWAAAGPNDSEGQQLLAEALRVDPSARVAQQAFERMEGVPGDHADLDAVIERYNAQEVARLDAETRRPSFRRAQMGFNNNIKFMDQVFHVQTEDSGLDAPHIITHLFADGGRVIKSHKRDYHEHVNRGDVADFVKGLMKAQHLEMVLMLREGRFEPIIAGREIGGMSLLTEPPNVENVKKLASKKEARAEAGQAAVPEARPEPVAQPAAVEPPPPTQPSARPPVPRPAPPPASRQYFRLHVLRSLWGGPERFEPFGSEALIGREGEIALSGEVFCHPREAMLIYKDNRLWLQDLGRGNGVFLRIRTPIELEFGDEFVIGDQLLRIEKNPVADDGPDPDPTYFYSSPKWPSSFRVLQVFVGGLVGACVVSRGNTLQVGSAIGDLVFPDDPLVGPQHCLIEEQAGSVYLTDLSSRTGVFVRIRGQQELEHGDELLVGRTRLVVDLSPAANS
ncbi:MAG: FHA domain-containing protein [Polyangiaceae bacterium]|nr:FHA domain-containing protein [Polyangiaceae bacterium]MBK8996518.1 FHA domain-containing protein [Myxococcales bacterium]MCL4755724.1 FHA domain-containing protein [Myxococcales bacterium]